MDTLNYFIEKYNLKQNPDIPLGQPHEIVNVGRLDLIRWIRELDFKAGVEVGVERGRYARQICEINSQMKLWGVDPYEKYEDYREYKDQAEMDSIYNTMLYELEGAIKHGKFEIIRKKSEDAVKQFEEESLDFVYIDGNHEFDYPLRDIEAWWPKVKKGGILAGHDYVRAAHLEFTIKDALREFTQKNNIDFWFVLGRYQKTRKEVRDNTRSWMIIKK